MNSSTLKAAAIIPARFASSRFPGKPLVDIKGTSMIMRTYQQVVRSAQFELVAVATDDKRIYDHVLQAGGVAVMTRSDHISGTDRVLEAAEKLLPALNFSDFDVVVNIQGDEPMINPQQIVDLVALFKKREIVIATQVKKITNSEELFSPNTVKVVTDNLSRARLFSRSAVPFVRGVDQVDWLQSYKFLKHIGIYAFRLGTLRKVSALPAHPLELAESLEQLRWLAHGFEIFVDETIFETVGIDTPEDLSIILNNFVLES